jgi:hypothetical protein
MPLELFANSPLATLGANVVTTPVAGTQETWTINVSSLGAAWPTLATNKQFRCSIGTSGEIILVTAGTTTLGSQSWTVTRGVENSNITTHATGDVIALILTGAAMSNMVQLTTIPAQTGSINITGAVSQGTDNRYTSGTTTFTPDPFNQGTIITFTGASGVTADCTVANPSTTNYASGVRITFVFLKDATTTQRNITFGTNFKVTTTAPFTTGNVLQLGTVASKITTCTFVCYDGTNFVLTGVTGPL